MSDTQTVVPAKRASTFIPPVFLVNAALRLRSFFLRCADAVVPPYMAMLDRFQGAGVTMSVHSAARYRIADHLVSGPKTAEALAKLTGTRADVLERMMHYLVAVNVFRCGPDGRFSNNNVSSSLITGSVDSIRGFTEFFGLEPVMRAWATLPDSLKDGPGAFQRHHGRTAWEWLDEDPQALSAFVEGMSSMTEVVAPAIAAAYPFGEVETVCDVGGGVGIVLGAVLSRHPHLRGILFDREGMLGQAGAYLGARGVADRVDLVAGSFFESVPRGADAYVIKTALHNWQDDKVLLILGNCRAAMEPGQRLVVADFMVWPKAFSTLVPFMDMAGLMVYDGRERSPETLSALFAQTGFRLGRTMQLPGVQAVFEAIAV